jgi:hypothetical protein
VKIKAVRGTPEERGSKTAQNALGCKKLHSRFGHIPRVPVTQRSCLTVHLLHIAPNVGDVRVEVRALLRRWVGVEEKKCISESKHPFCLRRASFTRPYLCGVLQAFE